MKEKKQLLIFLQKNSSCSSCRSIKDEINHRKKRKRKQRIGHKSEKEFQYFIFQFVPTRINESHRNNHEAHCIKGQPHFIHCGHK